MREEQLVSEKLAQDFFRKIAMADDPYDVINKLMLQKGPEGDAIRDIYNDVSVDHGLHPDDDFEEILDFMVQDFEDMQPAESVEEDCDCDCGKSPCEACGEDHHDIKETVKSVATESKSMLGEVVKELTEEEFDEAAGEKDACYHKVKSRYKVWPSAYASGALVKCRKVGAKNWGNSKK